MALTGDMGSAAGTVRVRRDGTFGLLAPETATPLALVLVELVQNAVEHGLGARGGEVLVEVLVQVRDPREGDGGRRLVVRVTDDGAGLPTGFDPVTGSGLGLQIVRTLVEGELGGTLTMSAADPGTVVELDLPVVPPAAPGL